MLRYEHVSSLARWNRLHINTKIYYFADWASPPYGIFFPYKHPTRKKCVTLKTSFIQAIHFQCCHNHLKPISGTNVHYLLDSYHLTTWLRCHMTCWVGSSHSSHPILSLSALCLVKVKIKCFWFVDLTTQLKHHVTLRMGFPHSKSPPC